MTGGSTFPSDLGMLAGCAAELAQAFVSLSSDIALVVDEHGFIQNVAQNSTVRITPLADHWVGRLWSDTVSAETRLKVDLMLSDAKATGVARRREINVLATGGEAVPVTFSALRLGACGPVLVVGRDLRGVSAIQQRFVEAQQEMERGYWKARQQESRYRQLFQIATDGVLNVDAHSHEVLEVNQVVAQMVGPGSSLLGRPVAELVSGASSAALHDLLMNATTTGKPAELHLRLRHRQELAAVCATPFRVGEELRLLLRVRPMGRARLASSVGSDGSLARQVDALADGVVVTDSIGRVISANPAFCRWLGGMTEEHIRGRPVGEWLGRGISDIEEMLQRAHHRGVAHEARLPLRMSGRTLQEVDVDATLLAEGDQECFGLTIRLSDPTLDARSDWIQGLSRLSDRVGELSLSQLMAESTRLIEQQLMSVALQRSQGDLAGHRSGRVGPVFGGARRERRS
jgi:transcriptional regulator PpsR